MTTPSTAPSISSAHEIGRRKRWPWVVLGLASATVIALGLCEWQGWPFLKGPIERAAEKRLQRRIDLGDAFSLHLLGSVRLDTDRLEIGAPPWERTSPSTPDTVRATQAHVDIPYGTLLAPLHASSAGPIRVTALRFGQVDATLLRDRSGQASWSLPSTVQPARREKTQMDLPVIDELVIRSGHVSINDAPTQLRLDATISTAEGDRATKDEAAGLAVDGTGSFRRQDFAFHVKSAGLLPLLAPGSHSVISLSAQANVGPTKAQFNGTGTDLMSLGGLSGDVALSGPSLAAIGDVVGVTLPTTSPFSLQGHLSKRDQLWGIQVSSLNVGDSRLKGSFSYDRRPAVPLLTGELTGPRLVLADLAPAFGASPAGGKHAVAAPGRILPDRDFDIPSLRAMNASVKLRLQRAELGSLFAEPLQPLEGDVDLHGGVLRVSNLQARTAGGELHGDVSLDPRAAPPQWNADLRWSDIELERWLSPRDKQVATSATASTSTKSKDIADKKPGYVSGQLVGRAQLRGQGTSTAKLLASLNGSIQTWVQHGQISHLLVEAVGLDVAKVLGILVTGDKPLPLNCAVASFSAQKGVVRPDTAVIDTAASTILVNGTISLADEQLALTVNPRPKTMSPASLRTPLHVEGSFAQPHVRLDPNPFGLKVLAAVALAAVNPLAGLLPLVEVGDPNASGCAQTLRSLRGNDAANPDGANDNAQHAPSNSH